MKRIQRKRTKGWRMPPNTIYVGRGTKWGNPFRIMGEENAYLYCDASHRRKILDPWVIYDHDQDIVNNPATQQMAVDHYRRWLFRSIGHEKITDIVRPPFNKMDALTELRGVDLCCWCPVGHACHADILLEIAAQTGCGKP